MSYLITAEQAQTKSKSVDKDKQKVIDLRNLISGYIENAAARGDFECTASVICFEQSAIESVIFELEEKGFSARLKSCGSYIFIKW